MGNRPGIDAAQHSIAPGQAVGTRIKEGRLDFTLAADGMADQDNLIAQYTDVDHKIDVIPAATAAGKINNRETRLDKRI